MRKREIQRVLTVTFIVLLLLIGYRCLQTYLDYRVPVDSVGRVMGVAVVENLDFLEGRQKRTSKQNPGVCMGGVYLPYTSDGTLYLSQDYTKPEWEGDLLSDSKETFLCTIADEAWEDKAAGIAEGHIFPIWLVGEDYYYELNMVVSGMPVMSITTDYSVKQDLGEYEEDPDRYYFEPAELYYGDIQVFDCGTVERSYDIFDSQVCYYYRGATSYGYEKRSYSISLLDKKGDKLDKSLLGMRSDNTWKLKSLVVDASRIREKTACDIWESFVNTNTSVNQAGPRMEYLELIVNNDYVGVYGIVEPVDEEKLGLDKNDVLYKIANWNVPDDEDIQMAVDKNWKIMGFIRIRYPELIVDYAPTWHPMRDYLNTFYRGMGDSFPTESKIHISNAVDMHIYLMTISGTDNYYKNLYCAADVEGDGSYTMRLIPWDLDLTFGSRAGSGGRGITVEVTDVYEEEALVFMKEQYPELIRPVMQNRWQECRESFLSTENIIDTMNANWNYLVDTGALSRENARWTYFQTSSNIDDIVVFQTQRMEFLDEYYNDF